jgi:hypothetical protein
MFRLNKTREVLWPVSVSVPVDGGVETVPVQIRYRLLSRSELAAIGDGLRALTQEERESATQLMGHLDQLLAERITGWEGIADETGAPLAFTPEHLAQVLDVPYLREAIETGLYAASRGALGKS